MTDLDLTRQLCTFIQQSPTAFHATARMAALLDDAGFARMAEINCSRFAPSGLLKTSPTS